MGLRYRKSVKLGPLRINFSKSGVGYSVGTKGYRVTKTATGRVRTTTSIPGTGISHVTERKVGSHRRRSKPASDTPKKRRWWIWGVAAVFLLLFIMIPTSCGSDQPDSGRSSSGFVSQDVSASSAAQPSELADPRQEPRPVVVPEPVPQPEPEPEPVVVPEPQPEPEPEPVVVPEPEPEPEPVGQSYVLNTSTKKIHKPTCSSVEDIKTKNRSDVTATKDSLLAQGYTPCGRCKP